MDIHLPVQQDSRTMDRIAAPHEYRLTSVQMQEYFPGVPTFFQQDGVDWCKQYEPETECHIRLTEVDTNGDGIVEVTDDGFATVRGLPPGQAFNLSKMVRYIAEQNAIELTDVQETEMVLRLNQRIIGPRLNTVGEAITSEGKKAEFTIRIEDGRIVLDKVLDMGEGTIGIPASELTQLLAVGIETIDSEEYENYLDSVRKAEKRSVIWDKIKVPLALFITTLTGARFIRSRKRRRNEKILAKRETGFFPGSPGDILHREIQKQLREKGGKYTHPTHWTVTEGVKKYNLKASSWGIDYRIAAETIIKEKGLFVDKDSRD